MSAFEPFAGIGARAVLHSSWYVVGNIHSRPLLALNSLGTYVLSARSSAQLPVSVRASYEPTPSM